MKIYVAASRSDIDFARKMMADLRDRGHTITHDWIADIDRNGQDDTKVTPVELMSCATNDVMGVMTCDLFWLISPERSGSGCFVEFGIALTRRIPIVVSGCIDRTLFYVFAETRGARIFASHARAFSHIIF